MNIETLYNCIGYYGFGSGVVMSKRGPGQPGEKPYCDTCQFRTACWQLHRERVQKRFPDVCAHIDHLGSQPDGPRLIMEFIKQHKTEPYIGVMMGNLEDGAHIACGLPPKDRGEGTLKFPFNTENI